MKTTKMREVLYRLLNDLLPCPFCGADSMTALSFVKQDSEDGYRPYFYVQCDYRDGGCGAVGGMRHSIGEAFDVWNMRAGGVKK